MFIAFDGVDGAGKTTLISKTYAWLESNGLDCKVQPIGAYSYIGDIIKEINSGKRRCDALPREVIYYYEAMLLSKQLYTKYIGSAREHIIMDRYLLSYYSYGKSNGVPTEVLSFFLEQLPLPDIYFLIDTPPQIACKRIENYRSIEKAEVGFANAESGLELSRNNFIVFQEAIRNEMLTKAQALMKVTIIDGNLSSDECFATIEKILKNTIE